MNSIQNIIKDTRIAMDKAVDSTRKEFSTIHAGKASPFTCSLPMRPAFLPM